MHYRDKRRSMVDMRPAGIAVSAAALVLLLAACSSEDPTVEETEAEPQCDPLTEADVAAIAEGAVSPDTQFGDGYYVALPPGLVESAPMNFHDLAVVEFTDPAAGEGIMSFAVGDNTVGPVVEVDGLGLTDWGAAGEAGSPMAEWIDGLTADDIVTEAVTCFG